MDVTKQALHDLWELCVLLWDLTCEIPRLSVEMFQYFFNHNDYKYWVIGVLFYWLIYLFIRMVYDISRSAWDEMGPMSLFIIPFRVFCKILQDSEMERMGKTKPTAQDLHIISQREEAGRDRRARAIAKALARENQRQRDEPVEITPAFGFKYYFPVIFKRARKWGNINNTHKNTYSQYDMDAVYNADGKGYKIHSEVLHDEQIVHYVTNPLDKPIGRVIEAATPTTRLFTVDVSGADTATYTLKGDVIYKGRGVKVARVNKRESKIVDEDNTIFIPGITSQSITAMLLNITTYGLMEKFNNTRR